MADVNAYGSLVSTRYQVIPLLNTAQTEGSEEAISTDSNLVGSAQAAGTFATQFPGGFVMAKGGIVAENDMPAYVFVQSAGKIKVALACASGLQGGGVGIPASLPYPKALAAGDTVVAMAQTTSDRTMGLSVACTNGEYHCFSVTPSGSGSHEFVSVLDGTSSIGTTLAGRTISHWFATSGNNDAELTSGVYLLDGSGVPVGSIGFCPSSGGVAATFLPCRHPVALNYRVIARTDA